MKKKKQRPFSGKKSSLKEEEEEEKAAAIHTNNRRPSFSKGSIWPSLVLGTSGSLGTSLWWLALQLDFLANPPFTGMLL